MFFLYYTVGLVHVHGTVVDGCVSASLSLQHFKFVTRSVGKCSLGAPNTCDFKAYILGNCANGPALLF